MVFISGSIRECSVAYLQNEISAIKAGYLLNKQKIHKNYENNVKEKAKRKIVIFYKHKKSNVLECNKTIHAKKPIYILYKA